MTLLLISSNGDTNLKFRYTVSSNSKAKTALRTFSFNGHHKVVELLLGAGANPDLQDKVRTQ